MDSNSFQIQALITFLVPFAMQLAKRSQAASLAWIDANKPKICVITGIFTALATSTGLEFTRAAHSLTISWPSEQTFIHGLVTFLVATIVQIAGQHSLYDGFWKHLVPVPKSPVKAAE